MTTQKILIIEDEEDYRQIIKTTLEMMDYDIIEATNGLDGLAAAKMYYPDLILCDINMPKMDGHTLLKRLKEDPEFTNIPFIFLTGNSGPGDMRKGMQLGADDYLTKPFSGEELIAAVKTRLTKNKSLQKYYESQFDDIKSNISHALPHEFRTPLNGILGFSQILLDDNSLSEKEVKEIGSMIYKSGQRLHHLLENMVLFGQLQLWIHDQNKVVEMRRESTLLLDVIRAVAEKQMTKHERAGALHISINNAVVQVSSVYMAKIVEEVIDNALKFSNAGTNVYISSEEYNSDVHIIIRDEGRGMSDEQIKKVSGFQQFERGYYEQQGAGLGLAVAKMLTELHDGSLALKSSENNGTTVTVSLPKGMKQ